VSLSVTPDENSIQRFILQRALTRPQFGTLIAVSVQKYAAQFSATIWVGREIDQTMTDDMYAIEDELSRLGISCSIILKSDKDLPFGGKYPLTTTKGTFTYRYNRIEATRDEDFVHFFSVRENDTTYRFRVSLTGTLGSLLRNRRIFQEEMILGVYREEIKRQLEQKNLSQEKVHESMLNSEDITRFSTS